MNKKLLLVTLFVTQQLFGASALPLFLTKQHKRTPHNTIIEGGCYPKKMTRSESNFEKKLDKFAKSFLIRLKEILSRKSKKEE